MLGYIMLALGLLAGVASVATLIYKKCYKGMTDAEIDAEEAAAGVATQKAEERYQQVEEWRKGVRDCTDREDEHRQTIWKLEGKLEEAKKIGGWKLATAEAELEKAREAEREDKKLKEELEEKLAQNVRIIAGRDWGLEEKEKAPGDVETGAANEDTTDVESHPVTIGTGRE